MIAAFELIRIGDYYDFSKINFMKGGSGESTTA